MEQLTPENSRLKKTMSVARGVFVVAAKRTAFGAYGGKVKDMTSTDLQEVRNYVFDRVISILLYI